MIGSLIIPVILQLIGVVVLIAEIIIPSGGILGVITVGLMGYSSSADNLLFFIPAISRALALQGYKTDLAAGLDAVLSELDGNGNNVVALREKTAAAAH